MKENFTNFISSKKTLLGAGPMSTNCIDAILEVSDSGKIPFQLIASRRQVDAEFLGGGYVNNWNTSEFTSYIKGSKKDNLVYITRDHGGPYQNTLEINNKMSYKDAFESSINSYLEDIENGFDFLHIDPSVDVDDKELPKEIIVSRTIEILGRLSEETDGLKNISIEVGTDEQSDEINSIEDSEYSLKKIIEFCKSQNIPKPLFFVIQNGTKVLEDENVGEYKEMVENKDFNKKLINLSAMFSNYGVYTKAHNSDYLDKETLSSFKNVGINAINIAPEYGVFETKKIIEVLQENNYSKELEEFLRISFESMKWKKWLKFDSKITDFEKSVLSGHYVFANSEFIELKSKIEVKLRNSGINLNEFIKSELIQLFKYQLEGLGWK